jgi:hypothetical protein
MEQKVSAWKANLNSGIILGLIGIIYSLLIYFMDLTFKSYTQFLFLAIQIVALFLLIRTYRDNYLHGYITFGQSFSAGLIICFYYAVIMAIFTYILYAFIDTGLVNKQLAFLEERMVNKGIPEKAMEAGMGIQRKILKPAIIAPLSIFGNMLWGAVLSLIVSIFVRREGNPITDDNTVN